MARASALPLVASLCCAQIMVSAITAQLAAGKFGFAPSVKAGTTAGLKLVDRPTGLLTGDPTGACVCALADGDVVP